MLHLPSINQIIVHIELWFAVFHRKQAVWVSKISFNIELFCKIEKIHFETNWSMNQQQVDIIVHAQIFERFFATFHDVLSMQELYVNL